MDARVKVSLLYALYIGHVNTSLLVPIYLYLYYYGETTVIVEDQ